MKKKVGMNNKGFTLVELMIVVAILGILMAVVLPGYRGYVLESQRTDTQVKLLQIIELQERFYIDNYTYTTDLTDLGYDTDPLIVNYNDTPAFSVSIESCPAADYADSPGIDLCFVINAEAQGDQVDDGDLLVDNRGRQEHNYAGTYLRDWNGNDL
jgi:type IV pilus assembly protein PilE